MIGKKQFLIVSSRDCKIVIAITQIHASESDMHDNLALAPTATAKVSRRILIR